MGESGHVPKSQNVSLLLYHAVFPAKYRRAVVSEKVDRTLRDVGIGISDRWEILFLEIGTDKDHVHFLVQSVPAYRPSKIVRIIRSITAREVFRRVPPVKKQLWGGEFWSDGYYISTVGRYGSETEIRRYVADQGREKEYRKLHSQQLTLWGVA